MIYIAKAMENFRLPVMHPIYEQFCQTVKWHKCAFSSLPSNASWVKLIVHVVFMPMYLSSVICMHCKWDKVVQHLDMIWMRPGLNGSSSLSFWVVACRNIEVQPNGTGNLQNNKSWPSPKALAVWNEKEKLWFFLRSALVAWFHPYSNHREDCPKKKTTDT